MPTPPGQRLRRPGNSESRMSPNRERNAGFLDIDPLDPGEDQSSSSQLKEHLLHCCGKLTSKATLSIAALQFVTRLSCACHFSYLRLATKTLSFTGIIGDGGVEQRFEYSDGV